MAYNENLAGRIRAALSHLTVVEEKKMFGGLAFMVNIKMCITVGADRIMCRIDPDMHDELVESKDCHTVIMQGQVYKGYVHVNEDNLKHKKDVDYWIGLALDYNKIAKSSKSKR
ncbi:MAG: TfoX/Sxy family protein [Chitinophagaceae bacterium]